MGYLYVTEPGTIVSLADNYMKVTKKDEELVRIPVETLESISIFSNAQLTTHCMEECLKREIPVSFYSKVGHYFGQLQTTGHINAIRQRKQCSLYQSEFAIALAKNILKAKIKNQQVVYKRYAKSRNSVDEQIVYDMSYSIKNIDNCSTINEIIGYEGTAAKAYFKGLNQIIDDKFHFNGRSRRPPKDAFNSMISLGYSILMNEIYGKVQMRGLNPYFGFIHQDHERHPTLVSDLLEEWRAVIVDSLVLSMINGHEIFIENFDVDEETGGWYFNADGMKKFISKFEHRLNTYAHYLDYEEYSVSFRRALDLQVAHLINAIDSEDASLYHPIIIR